MSGSGETLRGRTPLVMIDGIPQSNPLRPTGREMHTIDASMIERIEVIKGANASNGVHRRRDQHYYQTCKAGYGEPARQRGNHHANGGIRSRYAVVQNQLQH